MKPKNWILLWRNPDRGTMVYCQDQKWRKSPDFGTYSECVKQYSSPAWALKAVQHHTGDYEAVTLGSPTARSLGIGVSID
jgi:hypothetical protein